MQLAGQLVLSCALTALVEEVAFRGILASVLARRFSGPRALLHAALASSVVFALLHVVSDALAHATEPILVLQALLKASQTGLFGFCVACLFLKARAKGASFVRALALPVLIHFAFDVIYFGPAYFSAGTFPSTYLTGAYGDLALLVLTSLLLLPLAVLGARGLAREVLPCIPKNTEKGV